MPIETENKFAVGLFLSRGWVTFMKDGRHDLSPDDALNLAAWLVAVAEPRASVHFADVLEAVQGS